MKELDQELRSALLKCASLTEAEVDAYIAYEFTGIIYEAVPLDYTPVQPDEDISCLYADGILQVKTLRRHTNQISPETLAKVRRILLELFCPPYPWRAGVARANPWKENLLEKKLQRLMCALSVAMSALAILISLLK